MKLLNSVSNRFSSEASCCLLHHTASAPPYQLSWTTTGQLSSNIPESPPNSIDETSPSETAYRLNLTEDDAVVCILQTWLPSEDQRLYLLKSGCFYWESSGNVTADGLLPDKHAAVVCLSRSEVAKYRVSLVQVQILLLKNTPVKVKVLKRYRGFASTPKQENESSQGSREHTGGLLNKVLLKQSLKKITLQTDQRRASSTYKVREWTIVYFKGENHRDNSSV